MITFINTQEKSLNLPVNLENGVTKTYSFVHGQLRLSEEDAIAFQTQVLDKNLFLAGIIKKLDPIAAEKALMEKLASRPQGMSGGTSSLHSAQSFAELGERDVQLQLLGVTGEKKDSFLRSLAEENLLLTEKSNV